MESERKNIESIFHRVTHKESEKKSDPLDEIVHGLQKRSLNSTNCVVNGVACDEKRLNEQHQELDLFFHLIMQQVHVAAQQEERLLADRLVTLEKVEKQFGSLLLAQIQATEARIRLLEIQQARLQSAIDQHRSILGFLFIGIKSHLRLRSVKKQLQSLSLQLTELTETNKTFQYARRALLQDQKEKAVNLLERMRRERMSYAEFSLFESMHKWLLEAIERGQFLGFCIEEARAHTSKPQEGFFGLFTNPLASQEREWIERICHLHGLGAHDPKEEFKQHLEQFIEEKRQAPSHNLANYFLLLIRFLYLREGVDEESNAHVLPLYQLWKQRLRDTKEQESEQTPEQEAWNNAWTLGGTNLINRLNIILCLIKEIERLHQECAVAAGNQVNMNSLRINLAKLFRPFVWKSEHLLSLLPKEEKPPLFHRKQWQEELSNQCDAAFAWWIAQRPAEAKKEQEAE